MNRNGIRKLVNTLHLWMGLSSGLILFVVCLTGTVYTFRAEIERWIDGEKYYADVPARKEFLPADLLAAKVAGSAGGKITSVVVPADPELNWQVSVKKETKKAEMPGKGGRPKTYFVNPYTGAIEGEQGGSTSEFFTKVMGLHRWLLMEESGGRIIVGVATVIFVFMIISGLVLWFPAKLRFIKTVLTIKTSGSWKRLNHDLHNTLGFYSFLVLLLMSLTGLCWSFEWYRNGMSDVLGAKVFKGRNEKPLASAIPAGAAQYASLDNLIAEANRQFDYDGNLRLSSPENDSNAVVVTKTATGFFAAAGPDKIQFDRFSGKLLKAEAFSDKPFNVKIADSIRAIHTGEIFGTFSKIIYFIVCLIATSLPVTGTMIWLNKKKKRNKTTPVRVVKETQLT